LPDEGEINIEDLIANEGVIITLTAQRLLKRTNVSSYRAQRRGGKGVIGMTTKEGVTDEDNISSSICSRPARTITSCSSRTPAAFMFEGCMKFPTGPRRKGRSIANLLELKAGETIAALIRVLSKTNTNKEDVTWNSPAKLFFATKQGTVKKTSLNEFTNVRKGRIIAITIEPATR